MWQNDAEDTRSLMLNSVDVAYMVEGRRDAENSEVHGSVELEMLGNQGSIETE